MLLVQHMDADPAFQRHCLELMTAAAARGDVTQANIAYLTDRVLLAEGQPQDYGTQMHRVGGGWEPRNLADPETVDQRRAAAGLSPLADYVRRMAEQAPPPPARGKCPRCGVWAPYDEPAQPGDEVAVTCSGCGVALTFRPRA